MATQWKWTVLLFAVILLGYVFATDTSRASVAGHLNPPSQSGAIPVGGLLEN